MAKKQPGVARFVVDRGKWMNGHVEEAIREWRQQQSAWVPSIGTNLHDSITKLECCMGQMMRQCGASVKAITDKGFPEEDMKVRKFMRGTHQVLCAIADEAAGANDKKANGLTLPQREQHIKQLFAGHGITVTFKGRFQDAVARAQRALLRVQRREQRQLKAMEKAA